MVRARKLPIVIDAVQWDGDINKLPTGVEVVMGVELRDWLGDPDEPVAVIKTLEGKMIVTPGSWVMTGVNEERWAIKDEIFRKTYEVIE